MYGYTGYQSLAKGMDIGIGIGIGPCRELPPPNPSRRVPVALPLSDSEGDYELSVGDYAALDRFHKRTIYTVGTKSTRAAMAMRGQKLEQAVRFVSFLIN
jgi:hypothetical protein